MLAKLIGKSDIYKFRIEILGDVKTFDFLKVNHEEFPNILTQVTNITRDGDTLLGDCKIIGYRESGVLKNIRTPFLLDAQIEKADDKFIEETIGLNIDKENFIGVLEHHSGLKISIDLKKAITKHMAILAKSGAGKSYTVGVILEEVLKKNIPIVILDPHNEYASLKYPNAEKKDLGRLEKFNLKPQGFLERVKEFSPDTEINPQCEPITLDINKLKPQELVDSLPQKLSPAQSNILFNILSNTTNKLSIDELIFNISNEESNSKWSLITMLEQLKKLKLYSNTPTPPEEIVKYKRCSIISLKGVEPYVQETFISGLIRDLFDKRKKEEIPPFLLVLEEAHNFCPERALGETKASKVIRTIAAEGRKFGLGLCVISQRPAKVDKNVISQCTTQILLKITNPNDLKSVISSSEGVSSDSEGEIQKLNIGTCLLTGVIDIPLKINIRPRISKHGGETVDITLPYELDENGNKSEDANTPNENEQKNTNNEKTEDDKKEIKEVENKTDEKEMNKERNDDKIFTSGKNNEFIQHISAEITPDDAKVMLDCDKIEIQLVPASIIKLKTSSGKQANILYDRANKKIIKKIFPYEGYDANLNPDNLTDTEMKFLKVILKLEDSFNPAELMIKTDSTFNEILRVCDTLAAKGVINKSNKQFEIGSLKFAKKLDELNFYGNQKFEEISYDTILDSKINENETRKLFEIFGTVHNIKEIFILKYIGKKI